MDIIFLLVIFSLYMGGHSNKAKKNTKFIKYYSYLIFLSVEYYTMVSC